MAGTHRKKNEDALLIALACGATVEIAATQCGIAVRTVYRRLNDPEFKSSLGRTRGEIIERATGMMTAAAGEAVRTLLSLQKQAVPATVRLGAARAILELGMKLREMVDLEARIAALEGLVPRPDAPRRALSA